MRNLIFLITALLTGFTESKHKTKKLRHGSFSAEDNYESSEIPGLAGFIVQEQTSAPSPINFNGSLRKGFAMEAILLDPNQNLICSPISALLPLGKLILGTKPGKSRNELLKAIGYEKREMKMRLRSAIRSLKYLPGVTLSIVSVMYMSRNKDLHTSYHNDTMSVFGTTVEYLDFQRPRRGAAVINTKVFDGTHGKVDSIISPSDISSDSSLILINAIYFSGNWKYGFVHVNVDDFNTHTGVKKMPMMTRYGEYYYVRSDELDAEIVEIPYEGDKASFVIVLPFANDGLPSLVKILERDPNVLNRAILEMTEWKVHLTVPKFRIQSTLYLNSLYNKVGVTKLFSQSDSGISRILTSGDDIYVSRAIQKAYIEITEKGTEATVVTAVAMAMSAPPPMPRVTLKVDHPFLYFIKTAKGEQIFAGIFANT